jgi:hypothetical protein
VGVTELAVAAGADAHAAHDTGPPSASHDLSV